MLTRIQNSFGVKMTLYLMKKKNLHIAIFCMSKTGVTATSLCCSKEPLHLCLVNLKKSIPVTHLLQVMLVDGFKGQKVQDVKKLIQKMMVDNVCGSMQSLLHYPFCPSHSSWVAEEPSVFWSSLCCFGLLQRVKCCWRRILVFWD